MPKYSCPRCGYNSHIKTYLQKHFMRKKICKPILKDLPLNESFKECLGYDIEYDLKPNNIGTQKVETVLTGSGFHKNESNFQENESKKKNESNFQKNFQENESKKKIKSKKKYECDYCKKQFSTNSNMCKHMKKCKNKHLVKEVEEVVGPSSEMILKLELAAEREKVATERKKVAELTKQVEMLKLNNSKTNTIQGNVVINNICNISLNAFGKEDTKYITNSLIEKLNSIGPFSSVPKLLKELHFNSDHKENHNIYIPNKKQGYAKIYDGENWILTKKKDAIEDMTSKAFSLISDTTNLDENDKILKIREKYDNQEKKIVDKLHGNTELMILNNQRSIDHP